MTGRYNYRTGAIDTFLGRALMYPDEVTIAQLLGGARLSHGHFRQVAPRRQLSPAAHRPRVPRGARPPRRRTLPALGPARRQQLYQPDPRPQRPRGEDRGLLHRRLYRRGAQVHQGEPRPPLVRLPRDQRAHIPLHVPDRYAEPYRKMGLGENTARLYGMIANIDENLGRLLAKLKELNLEENTIVISCRTTAPTPSPATEGSPCASTPGCRRQRLGLRGRHAGAVLHPLAGPARGRAERSTPWPPTSISCRLSSMPAACPSPRASSSTAFDLRAIR